MLDLNTYKLRAQYVYSPQNLRKKLYILRMFDRFLRENKLQLNIHSVALFLDHLLRKNMKPGSISVYITDILSYFDIMDIDVDEKALKRLKRRIPRPRDVFNVDFLTKDEVRKLIYETPSLKYRLIYSLAFFYGRRIGEILLLKWSDIDFNNKTIRFKILKKKENMTVVKPLYPYIESLLNEYKDISKSNILFPITERAVEYAFKKHCKQLGIEPYGRVLKPHILRHTSATLYRSAGVPLDIVSREIVMHSNIQVTYKYYRGVTKEEIEKIPEPEELI